MKKLTPKEIREAVITVRRNRHEVTWDKDKVDEYIKATEILLLVAEKYLDWQEDK